MICFIPFIFSFPLRIAAKALTFPTPSPRKVDLVVIKAPSVSFASFLRSLFVYWIGVKVSFPSLISILTAKGLSFATSVRLRGFYVLFLSCLGNVELLENSLKKTKNTPYILDQLIRPIPNLDFQTITNENYSSFLNKTYVCSFILCNINRYHPLKWYDIQAGKTHSEASEINRYYAETAEHKFKLAMLSYFR